MGLLLVDMKDVIGLLVGVMGLLVSRRGTGDEGCLSLVCQWGSV